MIWATKIQPGRTDQGLKLPMQHEFHYKRNLFPAQPELKNNKELWSLSTRNLVCFWVEMVRDVGNNCKRERFKTLGTNTQRRQLTDRFRFKLRCYSVSEIQFKRLKLMTYRKFGGYWIKSHMNRVFKLRWVRDLRLFLRIYNIVACYHISE